ncbi:MAG: threonylcarbamoyl-AMP synthase [Muribaculaceae bacterium]|nr:threonylcarbamoyl-AMP synthase [Muribaculaceae bacterium]
MEYSFHSENINQRQLGEVTECLRSGGVIVYPTDTHHALGCDALNVSAIAALCKLKGINPEKQTLSIVCASLSQASVYARIDNRAFAIMRANLPGPFTFILPVAPTLPKAFKGRRQVGVRIPAAPIAMALAEDLGGPLLSGSIGDSDPYAYEHAVSAIVTDAGVDADEARSSSAIVDLTDSSDPVIVREGPVELLV